ncbi:serine/threonine-protein kinase Chk1-like [Oratosquilla oratoria]|uniref:serine/threonine-protein kinase Chk1-like n=1 Tax=Oratosquilla oratoria TaxID=337810 RepID=UPI003F7748A6
MRSFSSSKMTSRRTRKTLEVSKENGSCSRNEEDFTYGKGTQELHGQRENESAAGKRRHSSSSSNDQESACKRLRVHSESPSREGPCSLWTEVEYLGEGTFGIVTLAPRPRQRRQAALRRTGGQELHLYLEYAAGGNLSDEIGHYGLGEEQAQFYFVQLVSGVEYLHAQGVAHRDLKPKNLLLTEDRVLKIGDFGLSAEFLSGGEEVYLRGADGSRSYMAPEVLSGRYRGPPADIWSCGIILVEMVTGRVPWRRARPRDSTYHQWMQLQHLKKISDDPRPPSSSDTSVVELISYILTPDPEERATLPGIKENGWFNK